MARRRFGSKWAATIVAAMLGIACGSSDEGGCPQATPDACGGGASQFCTSLLADRANCGACGVACGTGHGCSAGQCVLTCTAQTRTLAAVDSASVNYAAGVGQWIDNNTRAFLMPPDYDVTGWVKFDLSSVPATALVTGGEMRLDAMSIHGTPRVVIQHSPATSWTRATATAPIVPRGAIASAPLDVQQGWNAFTLDLSAHDLAEDLAAGSVTLGVTNTSGEVTGDSDCWAYFRGSDDPSTRPVLELQTCE